MTVMQNTFHSSLLVVLIHSRPFLRVSGSHLSTLISVYTGFSRHSIVHLISVPGITWLLLPSVLHAIHSQYTVVVNLPCIPCRTINSSYTQYPLPLQSLSFSTHTHSHTHTYITMHFNIYLFLYTVYLYSTVHTLHTHIHSFS